MRDTKLELIKAGADLFLRQSYQGTGISDILGATGIPKGSFYHFFANKEEFGLEVIAHQARIVSARWAEMLENGEWSPLQRIHLHFEYTTDRLAREGFAGGCPFGTMAQEMAALSEPLRLALDAGLRKIEAQLADCVREGQRIGEIIQTLNAAAAARFIWYAWQGALIAAKAAKSPIPLRDTTMMVTEYFLPATRANLRC